MSMARPVREVLVQLQRILQEGGIVMEGRDITSVVLPDAEVKVFHGFSGRASPSKAQGIVERGIVLTLEEVKLNLPNATLKTRKETGASCQSRRCSVY